MYHFRDQYGNIDTEREEAYRTAIEESSRPYDTIVGLITFTDNSTMEIDGSCLPTNAVTISRECVDNSELMFGGVFTNTLKLTVIPDNEHSDRYQFYGAKIELTYQIEVEREVSGEIVYEMESVPLGIFYVADADKPDNTVKLTAYDSITLLDKEIGTQFITGLPWSVFQQISVDTGYPLAFSESDLSQFVNSTEYYIAGSNENGIKTYRDLVKLICQMLGCFALDDRTGRLALKAFSSQPDLVLGNNETEDYPWYTLVPSDYKTVYKGIVITSMSGTYRRISDNVYAYGSIMKIDDAPAWDYGEAAAQQAKINNLYSLLRDNEDNPIIAYTPCSCDMPADATFECGDMIEFVTRDYDENEPLVTIITSIEWKFHNGMTIESVGINPILESSSEDAENEDRILSKTVEKSKLQFVTFSNTSTEIVNNQDTEMIAECIFTPTSNTATLLVCTVLVDIAVDDIPIEVPVKVYNSQTQEETEITDIYGNPVTLLGTSARDGKCEISFFYKVNDFIIPSEANPYIATDRLIGGKHIVTLSYPFLALDSYKMVHFQLWVTANGGSVTIPERTLKGTFFGQALTDVTGFGGALTITEDYPKGDAKISGVGVRELTHGEFTITHIEDPNVTPYVPMDNQLVTIKALIAETEDDVSLYNIASMSVKPIGEDAVLTPNLYLYGGLKLISEDGLYLAAEDDDRFITENQGAPE